MKIKAVLFLGILVFAIFGALIAVGCGSKPASEPTPAPGPAEKAGAAVDNAVKKTDAAVHDIAEKTNEAAKDAANKATQKTGEALEKVGAAVEKAGADMRNDPPPPTK